MFNSPAGARTVLLYCVAAIAPLPACADADVDALAPTPLPETRHRAGEVGADAPRSIGAGSYHSCAVVGGAVECWGLNISGQAAGDGVIIASPTRVDGIDDAVAVTTGALHSCALRASGEVWCWGRNDQGQLGDGTHDDADDPVQVVGITTATAVSGGGSHTCAIASGTLKCWGDNSYGQLASGNAGDSSVPVTAGSPFFGSWFGLSATDVSAGYRHTCAVGRRFGEAVDSAYCWGWNHQGQLGNGGFLNPAGNSVGAPIALGETPTKVASGYAHSCAVLRSTGASCWGDNGFGQLSVGSTTDSAHPQRVSFESCFWGCVDGELTDATDVSAGDFHTCFISGGAGTCAGRNAFGQLGFAGANLDEVGIPLLGLLEAVSAGGNHTCGWSPSGELRCAGYNGFGQIGDGTTDNQSEPVVIIEDADNDGVADEDDVCPQVYDPTQVDTDADALGDACDPCTDTDGDGRGNPGFPENTCPDDNCPQIGNAPQGDADADGVGDACDPCTDLDDDGAGEPGYPSKSCPTDNCVGLANPDQAESDGDGLGDACDPCPDDVTNDGDGDGICGDPTHCPSDTDGDGTFNCDDECPYDPNKVAAGERGCGLEDPDFGVAAADMPMTLTIAGASLYVPPNALTPGTHVELFGTPTDQSGFPQTEFPEEIALTDVYTVTFSSPQAAAAPMLLSVDIPAPAPYAMFGRSEAIGAYGAPSPDSLGWQLDFGFYNTDTNRQVYSLSQTADSIAFATATTAAGVLAGPPPPMEPTDFVATRFEFQEDWHEIAWAVVCDPTTTVRCTPGEVDALATRFLATTTAIKDQVASNDRFRSGVIQRVPKSALVGVELLGKVVGIAHPQGYDLVSLPSTETIALTLLEPNGTWGSATGVNAGVIRVMESVLDETLLDADTVAHELFHGVQRYEMRPLPAPWIVEGTAVAAEAAVIHSTGAARLEHRADGRWRDWSYPLNTADKDREYGVGEFFLFYDNGDLDYLGPMFEQLGVSSGQNYVTVDDAVGGTLEERYVDLIERRSSEDPAPPDEDVPPALQPCRNGDNSCNGTKTMHLDAMSAQRYYITMVGDDPACPPGEHVDLDSRVRSFQFIADPPKEGDFTAVVTTVAGTTTFGSGVEHAPIDDGFEVWIVNHDSLSFDQGAYAFIAEVEDTCVPDCSDGTCDLATESSISCPADCFCGDGVCESGFEDEVSCPEDCLCGNAMIDWSNGVWEQCDDGNQDAGDGCAPDCTWEGPHCDRGGDGIPDVGAYTCGDQCCDNLDWCYRIESPSSDTIFVCSGGLAGVCDNAAALGPDQCPYPPPTTPYHYHACVTSVRSEADEQPPFGLGTCTVNGCIPYGAECPY